MLKSRAIKGEVEAPGPSRFFEELVNHLEEYNHRTNRTIEPRGIPFGRGVKLSMTRLIGESLDLTTADSAVAKIRTGQYLPSNEKIEQIARRLQVPPSSFTDYVVREISSEAKTDPDIVNMFRVLSGKSKTERKQIIRSVIRQAS